MRKRVGIINGGGDCPGLNTVIDAVVKCLDRKYEILGFHKGFEGLLNKDYQLLTRNYTNIYKFAGGTVLKSVNKGNFPGKKGFGEKSLISPKILKQTIKNYAELELEGLIVLGGDGTLTVAQELFENGLNIVGVPKSIDNDLGGTDLTFGFLTAVEIATQALDRLETTAYSHDRVMILEAMGRNAGWISLYSGIAGGANMILIPEIKFTEQNILNFLLKRINNRKPNTIIIISEGAVLAGKKILKNTGGQSSEVLLGGVGDVLAQFLNSQQIDARCTRLGHIQRGGSPNSMDRLISRMYGVHAAKLFEEKIFGYMVSYSGGSIQQQTIKDCVAELKLVNSRSLTVQSAKKMGVCFGD